MSGEVGGNRPAQSIIDDDGHYTDIHGIPAHRPSVRSRSSGYEHYVDIDRIIGDRDHPGSGDQAARSQGYEGLDPSDLAALRQPQRPHDYVRLGDEEAAGSTQQTTEEIEVTETDQLNTVSRPETWSVVFVCLSVCLSVCSFFHWFVR